MWESTWLTEKRKNVVQQHGDLNQECYAEQAHIHAEFADPEVEQNELERLRMDGV